jgi:hypothetical protein
MDLPAIVGNSVILSLETIEKTSFVQLIGQTSIYIEDISAINPGIYLMYFHLNDGKQDVIVPFSLVILQKLQSFKPEPILNSTSPEPIPNDLD